VYIDKLCYRLVNQTGDVKMKKPLQVHLEEQDRTDFNNMNKAKNVKSSEVLRAFIQKEIKKYKKELDK